MKQHLKTIEEMLDLFGEDAFYAISLHSYSVTFQGKFNSNIIKRCQQDGYTSGIDDNGYVALKKDNTSITLTQ